MSNTELGNTELSDVQTGSKEHQAQRRSRGAASKLRQSKRSSIRPHVKSRDPSVSKKQSRGTQIDTKQGVVIQMLRRQSGVSIDDIIAKTKWQPHSVRGFFSGVVRKKLMLPLVSNVGKDGVRRYHIAPVPSSKV